MRESSFFSIPITVAPPLAKSIPFPLPFAAVQESDAFTAAQKRLLAHYVTDTEGDVFALKNLPEVVKGALFSRYSRSRSGLRALLLKEFLDTAPTPALHPQQLAIEKAQDFYDRILDGYGDDSIGELGGAHLAMENLSMLASQAVEDCRIGGSPLEKSTRYVSFAAKRGGEYPFYRDPLLLASPHGHAYCSACNRLFTTYAQALPQLMTLLQQRTPNSGHIAATAYMAALRAQALDCLRGLLPASTLTNVGLYGNGRFFEGLLRKLHVHPLSELQALGQAAQEQLQQIIPSFIRRADSAHKDQRAFATFADQTAAALQRAASQYGSFEQPRCGVVLIDYDRDAYRKIAAALLFNNSQASLQQLQQKCSTLSAEELSALFASAACYRRHRRQKSPRALEHASFTFEIVADFGVYRDLHRHRMLTQQRQLLRGDHGYFLPPQIRETPLQQQYVDAIAAAQDAYAAIASDFPQQAQYVVPMACHLRWYMHCNLRSLQWICELRSSAAGHPSYRLLAQQMASAVRAALPLLAPFFRFVDDGDYSLGRLQQEAKIAQCAPRRAAKDLSLAS